MNEKIFSTVISTNDEQVIDFYDKYAEFWDDRFGNKGLPSTAHFFSRRLNSFLEIVNSIDFLSEKKAAELGVGTGIYIDATSKLFQKVIAVDGSPNMIKKLKQKIENFRLLNVMPVVSRSDFINEIKDKSIDVVYFFGLIEHVTDRHAFLQEIDRILKSGGHVVGIAVNNLSPWYKIKTLIRGTGKHCSSDHLYNKRELKSLFESYGFKWEQHSYWGLVYAGLSNSLLYRLLSFLEPIIEKSSLAFLLGGITFKVCKK